MSKHHRSRAWAPAPERLSAEARVVDNHTHVLSVVPFASRMDKEAQERGQEPVPVYSVDQIIQQAQDVGVESFIEVACDLPSLEPAVNLAREHAGVVWAALAIHPNEAVLHGHHGAPGPDGLPVRYQSWHDTSFEDAIEQVAVLARAHPQEVVAIGETGMDLFRTGAEAEDIQRQAFREHIALAKELNLPLQIHDRDAHAQVIDTLLADGAPARTVFHSYSGDAAMAQVAAEQGWYLSFSGTVSFKNNDHLRQSLKIVDLDHILVETDAPYLTPMPYRGRTNAPYMIPYTLQAMADALELPLEELAKATRQNTRVVYGI